MVKIMQLDYETGELIEVYESIKLAAKDNYISENGLTQRLSRGFGTAIYKNKQLAFTRAYSV